MADFLVKMEREREDLGGKIKRAQNAFLNVKMSEEERNLLETQIGFMRQYHEVLCARIALYK